MGSADVHLSQTALARDIAERVKLSRPDVSEIVQLILTLYAVRDSQGFSAEEMAEQIAEASQATTDDRLRQPKRGWLQLKRELAELLSFDNSIGLTSKAAAIAYESPQHFHGIRILTDARPIFAGPPEDGPTAFVLIHTLKIDVHGAGDDREIFITMNAEDLSAVRAAVDRALAKEENLRAILPKTGIPILSPEEQ
jgi:hypothetical protein